MNIYVTYLIYVFFKVNFLFSDNEILKAHTDYVHRYSTIAVSVLFFKHMQDRPNNIATDW